MANFNWFRLIGVVASLLLAGYSSASEATTTLHGLVSQQNQVACAGKRKYGGTHYTVRQTKSGTSFTSRTKTGNTTVTQTRRSNGKSTTTISNRVGNTTYSRSN